MKEKEKQIFEIARYGVKSSTDEELQTGAFQAAIDACGEKGGILRIGPGRYVVGTLRLVSGVEMHLEEGAELLGSTKLNDYTDDILGAVEAPEFNKCLIYAEEAHNIGITGKGIINGRGYESHFPIGGPGTELERPMLIRFVSCSRVSLSGITLKDSASWCTHLVDCDRITAREVTIDSFVNRNNDGFDLDGCTHALIENCDIRTGDDAICPKSTTPRLCEDITIRNCRISSNTAAFKCGTSSRGGFRNIVFRDSEIKDNRMGTIKLLMVDGGIMEDITISNLTMDNVEGPLFIRLGNRGRPYDTPITQIQNEHADHEGVPPGKIGGIRISGIKARVCSDQKKRWAIMIAGIPEHPIEDIILEDIEISFPGGGTDEDARISVPEDDARYPEQFFFGTLPCWGAFIRHARNITFRNVSLVTREPDRREKMILEDVKNFSLEQPE